MQLYYAICLKLIGISAAVQSGQRQKNANDWAFVFVSAVYDTNAVEYVDKVCSGM